jgi:hypothetical protein
MTMHYRPIIVCLFLLVGLALLPARPLPTAAQEPGQTTNFWTPSSARSQPQAPSTRIAPAAQTLASSRAYPLYEQGIAVRVGDVNNDGLEDVVLTTMENRLRVWLQNPSCHELQQQIDLPFGPKPTDLAIADLNGDGLNDVIVVRSSRFDTENTPGSVAIMMQTPAGLVTAPISYPVGLAPSRVVIGDVTNDGRPDIIVSSGDNLDVLAQQPNGSFVTTIVDAPKFTTPFEIGIADFTGDGRNDIALMGNDPPGVPQVRVFQQLASGGFSLFAELARPVGTSYGYPSSMAVGDVNGDGRADIVVTYSANVPSARIAVFLQQANHTFGSATLLETYDSPTNAKIVDMNQDGRPDIVVMNNNYGSYTTHYQQPGGVLGTAVTVPTGYEIQSGMHTRDSDIGDITGDGTPDIAYTSLNIGLAVVAQGSVPSCPTASVPAPARRPSFLYGQIDQQGMSELVQGDVNGDGRQDVLSIQTNISRYAVRAIQQQPDGGFALTPTALLTSDYYTQGLSAGDLNGDGRLDVAMAEFYTDTIILAHQQPNGAFGPAERITIGPRPVQTLIADWTGDGKSDLAVIAQEGLYVLAQRPDGSLAAPMLRAAGQIGQPRNGPQALSAIADWNGDGRMDLIACWDSQLDSFANVRVLLQQADGAFQLLTPGTFSPVSGPSDLQVGDVNSDGRPDVVVSDAANRPLGKLAVLLQQPDGSLGSRTVLGDASEIGYDLPGGLALADLNGDQRTDILVMNAWWYFSAWTQNAVHTFDPLWRYYSVATLNTYRPHSTVVIDENKDGIPEAIALASPDGYLLFMKPVVLSSEVFVPLARR